MNEFTKNQLMWMVKLFANGGRYSLPKTVDKRELRPVKTLEKSKLVKIKSSRLGYDLSVTKMARKISNQ